MRLPFRLETGHVNAGRTLGLARLAANTQIHHLGQPFVIQTVQQAAIGQGRSQGVGPGTSRVAFITRGHERRTHRAHQTLATLADAAAHAGQTGHAAVAREVEVGSDAACHYIRAGAEILIHRRGVDDLAGIEQPVRIESSLDLAERGHQRRAEHLLRPTRSHESVTVLAGHRPAELQHQIRNSIRDPVQTLHIVGLAKIQHRADMNAPDAGMGVVTHLAYTLLGEQLLHTLDVIPKTMRIDCGVFDKRVGLAIARLRHQEPQPVLSHLPDVSLLSGIGDLRHRIGTPVPLDLAGKGLETISQAIVVVVEQFDDEDRGRVSLNERAATRERAGSAGSVEDHPVDKLDGRRPMFQKGRGHAQGIGQAVEVQDTQSLGERKWHQIQHRLGHHTQRALAAADDSGWIHARRDLHQSIEPIPAVAP